MVPMSFAMSMRVAPLLNLMDELAVWHPRRDRDHEQVIVMVMVLLVAVFVPVVAPLPVTMWKYDVGPMRVAPLLLDE